MIRRTQMRVLETFGSLISSLPEKVRTSKEKEREIGGKDELATDRNEEAERVNAWEED